MAASRLPGIYVDRTPAWEPEPLPRMDIALFAGFAARGPVGCPRVCESITEYEQEFGAEDFVVGRVSDVVVRGALGASVRAFFRNGGRRCWALRLRWPEVSTGTRKIEAADYLDTRLMGVRAADMAAEAEYILYPRERPAAPNARQCDSLGPVLDGVHAALSTPEATILCVPDAAFAGWMMAVDAASTDATQFEQLPVPAPVPGSTPVFDDCSAAVSRAVTLRGSETIDGLRLHWTAAGDGPFVFIVEESETADFSHPIVVYRGTELSVRIRGLTSGELFYRVRVQRADEPDSLSPVLHVEMPAVGRFLLQPATRTDDLVELHRQLLRICIARGDLFGVMSLPKHHRETEALKYATDLVSAVRNAGEAATLSYGALYHPWLSGREENSFDELTTAPPDGSIAGVYAMRSWTRGAWIAPANERLHGVVKLEPDIREHFRLDFQNKAINLIQQEPEAFVCLNETTLSTDPDLRPVHVRRLLMLLRRLALREGVAWVFEPNSDVFRRSVQRGFERLLEGMYERGAFAGRTPRHAFEVVTSPAINTRQAQDLGRFIVELKVAPSREMRFVTLRLIQSAERTLLTEGA